MTIDLTELDLDYKDFCLSSTIYSLYKIDKKNITVRRVIDKYRDLFNIEMPPNPIIDKLKYYKDREFIDFVFKDFRGNQITKRIVITNRFLLYHKLTMLVALLMADENEFHKVAEPTLKKILKYLKEKYPKEKK